MSAGSVEIAIMTAEAPNLPAFEIPNPPTCALPFSRLSFDEDGQLTNQETKRLCSQYASARPVFDDPGSAAFRQRLSEQDRLERRFARAELRKLASAGLPAYIEARRSVNDEFFSNLRKGQLPSNRAIQRMAVASPGFYGPFGWFIPSIEICRFLSRFGPILEIGGGSGIFAHLARGGGVDIISTDVAPPEESDGLDIPVHRYGAAQAVAAFRSTRSTILAGWPNVDGTAWFLEAMRQMRAGDILLLVSPEIEFFMGGGFLEAHQEMNIYPNVFGIARELISCFQLVAETGCVVDIPKVNHLRLRAFRKR